MALCGAMKNSYFLLFLQKCFFLILDKKVWQKRYVALCGAMKIAVFFAVFAKNTFFFDFGEKSVALCGAMWRYEK